MQPQKNKPPSRLLRDQNRKRAHQERLREAAIEEAIHNTDEINRRLREEAIEKAIYNTDEINRRLREEAIDEASQNQIEEPSGASSRINEISPGEQVSQLLDLVQPANPANPESLQEREPQLQNDVIIAEDSSRVSSPSAGTPDGSTLQKEGNLPQSQASGNPEDSEDGFHPEKRRRINE